MCVYIYIYIYTSSEREREREFPQATFLRQSVPAGVLKDVLRKDATNSYSATRVSTFFNIIEFMLLLDHTCKPRLKSR